MTELPHDEVSEKCLLGSVILSNVAFWKVSSSVRSEMFFSGSHRLIWNVVGSLYRETACESLDIVVLMDRLDQDAIGFKDRRAVIHDLMQTVPHADNAEYYAKSVIDLFGRRELLIACERVQSSVSDKSKEVDSLLSELEGHVERVRGIGDDNLVSVSVVAEEWLTSVTERIDSQGESGRGLLTGWNRLDEMVTGFRGSELTVIAARPGTGKTAFVGNIARNLSKRGYSGLFFSLEMKRTELFERLAILQSLVDSTALRHGQLTQMDEYKINEAYCEIKTWKLAIDDHAGRTIGDICAKSRSAKSSLAVEYMIIDYLQLVEADDRRQPRIDQVRDISRKLKNLAKTLDIPVIALAQLNREVEKRSGPPRASDLGESGSIEQDADTVLLLHRPEMSDPECRPGECDIIVAKNRHGPIGTVPMRWDKKLMRFREEDLF